MGRKRKGKQAKGGEGLDVGQGEEQPQTSSQPQPPQLQQREDQQQQQQSRKPRKDQGKQPKGGEGSDLGQVEQPQTSQPQPPQLQQREEQQQQGRKPRKDQGKQPKGGEESALEQVEKQLQTSRQPQQPQRQQREEQQQQQQQGKKFRKDQGKQTKYGEGQDLGTQEGRPQTSNQGQPSQSKQRQEYQQAGYQQQQQQQYSRNPLKDQDRPQPAEQGTLSRQEEYQQSYERPQAWRSQQMQSQPQQGSQQLFQPPPPQQAFSTPQWGPSRGRGNGRGSSIPMGSEISPLHTQFPEPEQRRQPKGRGSSTPVGSEFLPLQQQMQQSRGRGKDTPPRPTPAEGGSSVLARGDTGQTLRESERLREVTSAMQQVSVERGAQPRPVIGGGDAPSSQIVPQTSTGGRRGGKEAKLKTIVKTNFFPLNIGKLERAIHYDVAIVPDKPKKLLRSVMDEFRSRMYRNRWPAYDGSKNLYSSSPLFQSNEISDMVKIMEDDKEKEFHVTIKFATYVDLTCLRDYIQNVRGRNPFDLDKPMQALQCLDIVLRSAPAFSCIPVGRSYFTRPNEPFRLGDGAVLYTGFFQAAILGWKPFVNIDVAHKAFPAAMNVVELFSELDTRADLSREVSYGILDTANKHMKQLKIQYELPRNQASRRMYRVNELGPTPNKAKFKDESGRVTTVTDYFKTKKNVTLRYPNLPTLWVGSRNRENKILLPVEFCTILPDQAVNKKMTENQTRNMIRQTATSTQTRMNNILHSASRANYNESPAMREFGLTVSPTPQEVEARILHPPTLEYSNNKKERVFKGTWRTSQFVKGAVLSSWTVLCLESRMKPNEISYLETELMKFAKTVGMTIIPPAQYTVIPESRNQQALQKDLKQYFSQKQGLQMIVVILSRNSFSYNLVKEASEIAVGCLTQCLKPTTVSRLSPSTVGNILLKINAKLNGENHYLQGLKSFLVRPCMIMGADVTHPGPDSRDFPSVAAVTASFDAQFFKYSFEWRLQPARQEMIQDLQEITRQHLLNFYKRNNRVKPEKLIYIRDGVSDGEFVRVLNVELMAIRAACAKLEPSYKPSIVFIVVQKRHHTRFFPTDTKISEDRNFNVPAGTCVDTEITHPSMTDFYLVSHASIQGVAKPTKYVKLWDDCDMSEDEIEKLMYYLCHMFARCNRSVSYPAPTYYAHLAAARARVYCEVGAIDMNNLPKEQQRLTIKENFAQNMPMFFV